ncbi:MAG: hypothetical protein CMM84_01780 [Rhodothermaceae bacterium]|nr:hypothetical protein [Rhodothermaceae bacterium]
MLRVPLLFSCALALAVLPGCFNRDLRGSWSNSSDGGTYLAIDKRNGPACQDLRVDEEPWPHEIGEPGPVEPGVRFVDCGLTGYGIGVEVREGTTYRFNYWGP